MLFRCHYQRHIPAARIRTGCDAPCAAISAAHRVWDLLTNGGCRFLFRAFPTRRRWMITKADSIQSWQGFGLNYR